MDEEIASVAEDLRSPRNVTAFAQAVETLKSRLSTPRFCEKLGVVPDGGESGWTTLFKAVIIGLSWNRKWRRPNTVDGLKRMVDEADRAGAVLDVDAVERFISRTADELLPTPPAEEDADGAATDPEIPAPVAPMYLAILSTLCSRSEYFRGMARQGGAAAGGSAELGGIAHAQEVADRLVALCASLTEAHDEAAAGGGAEERRGVAVAARPAAAAAKLLLRLTASFPFALPERALSACFRHMERLAEWSLAARTGGLDDAPPFATSGAAAPTLESTARLGRGPEASP